jgi:hypothetical protein
MAATLVRSKDMTIANNGVAEIEVAGTKCVCLHTSRKIYDIDFMLTGFVPFT